VADVNLYDAEIADLLNSPDGPVGLVIEELSVKAADIAKINANIQKPWNWSWSFHKSTSSMPRSVGYLKSRTRAHFPAFNGLGLLYGGVNAPYAPTLFLERPARQQHDRYPFMSTALDMVEL
jgi:hypothetical protein